MSEEQLKYSAKKLVLSLVKEAAEPMSSHTLVGIGDLFGIRANTIRVSINRLVNDDMLQLTDRGVYELGRSARSLAEAQERWRYLEEELKPWAGDWYALHVAHLGRRDRAQLRRRGRAAGFWGFRELEQGLLVRPANLTQNTQSLKQSLCELGMETEAVLMSGVTFEIHQQPSAMLWNVATLDRQYGMLTREMLDWLEDYEALPLKQAAMECFLIGDRVLRAIAYDPRLPDEMVDTCAREDMVETMKIYDDVGNRIWAELINTLKG